MLTRRWISLTLCTAVLALGFGISGGPANGIGLCNLQFQEAYADTTGYQVGANFYWPPGPRVNGMFNQDGQLDGNIWTATSSWSGGQQGIYATRNSRPLATMRGYLTSTKGDSC